MAEPIGLFGGTFDPIHYGHLRTAFELWQSLKLAEVRFLPTGNPPHREAPLASSELRLDMVRAAVVGLVKSLANEFGKDGILVNNVGPGFTATDRLKELAKTRSASSGKSEQEILQGWAADAPLQRLGEPREVAETIVWLASERASYITGQTVLVDGGIYKGL